MSVFEVEGADENSHQIMSEIVDLTGVSEEIAVHTALRLYRKAVLAQKAGGIIVFEYPELDFKNPITLAFSSDPTSE